MLQRQNIYIYMYTHRRDNMYMLQRQNVHVAKTTCTCFKNKTYTLQRQHLDVAETTPICYNDTFKDITYML